MKLEDLQLYVPNKKERRKKIVPSRHTLFLAILLYSLGSNFINIMYHRSKR